MNLSTNNNADVEFEKDLCEEWALLINKLSETVCGEVGGR
jgi:hypothetical protein